MVLLFASIVATGPMYRMERVVLWTSVGRICTVCTVETSSSMFQSHEFAVVNAYRWDAERLFSHVRSQLRLCGASVSSLIRT